VWPHPRAFVQAIAAITMACWCAGCGGESREKGERETPAEATQVAEVEIPASFEDIEPEAVYATVCAACHGEEGAGNPALGAPSLAGMPKWMVREQTGKFRDGLRGAHPEDPYGQQMKAIAQLLSETQIEAAAETVSAFEPFPTARSEGDVDIDPGRYLFANRCMECHRYTGTGEIVFHSAPLVYLDPPYLERSLRNYREGKRGAVEGDLYGQKMVDVASRLSDEQIEQLVAYIGELAHGDDPRPARER